MTSDAQADGVVRSLSASSARMAGARPVFIVGHPRSGTSLLFRTLQQHPTFRPRTIDLHETQIFSRLSTAHRFDAHPPRQLLGYMLGDRAHFDAFLDETRSLRRTAALSAPLSLPLRGDLPLTLWRAQRLHLVVRSYLAHAWAARGAERLVEKSPRNTPHIEKIRLVSPGSRLLFVCRHPIDVYSSYLKRAKVDPRSKSWADISAGRFTRIYQAAVRRALTEAAGGGPLLVVKYEDFTADPEGQFRRICDFVDVPFEAGALGEPSSTSMTKQRGEHLQSGITQHTKRWSDFVQPDQARRIESRLADVMERLGYTSALS